ncbi:MAG: magnesium transporter, partial [Deltaproteobacteria bacterium]|nr:magnesium transporter [Deltaproteobacteria bacterium]
ALVLFRDQHLREVVALSIFVTMTCSATMGSIIPAAFKRLGYDPAVSSGPLVTTLTDILSILIYFSVSSFLLA